MRLRFSFFIILFFLLLSCKSKDYDAATPNEYAAKFIQQLNPTHTFLFDFPLNNKGEFDTLTWQYLKEYERKLGLSSLEKGFDSIQIRIGFDEGLDVTEKLVILKNDKKKWLAELSEVYNHYNEDKGVVDSLSRKIAYANPKSGWIKFINKLFDLKILAISDDSKIPGFKRVVVTDGDGYFIEIAIKNMYRFYTYENPNLLVKKYWQAANIIATRKLLYEEFAILTKWDKEREEVRKKRFAEKERKREESRKAGDNKIIATEITDSI